MLCDVAFCCSLLGVGCVLFVVGNISVVCVRCLMAVIRSLLLMFVVWCLLRVCVFAVGCFLFVVCC